MSVSDEDMKQLRKIAVLLVCWLLMILWCLKTWD